MARRLEQRDEAIRERNAGLVARLGAAPGCGPADADEREALFAELVLVDRPVARSISARYARRHAGQPRGPHVSRLRSHALLELREKLTEAA